MYENSTESRLRSVGMAGALGTILFAYIFLVFLVNHRISMMQCNPMSRPGESRAIEELGKCCGLESVIVLANRSWQRRSCVVL